MIIWMRHEPRANEARAPLTPAGASDLIAKGWRVVVEDADDRCIPTQDYRDAECEISTAGSWQSAPDDAIILGLKELRDDGSPLRHRHIMFGHAYKAQASGRVLLDRFAAGGGTLLDLEYLVDDAGRRVAAFGYWAGFAGAALSIMAWGAQQRGQPMPPVSAYDNAADLTEAAAAAIPGIPSALIIGALGRVGTGASDMCRALGITPISWDMAETAHGGPFPEVLHHAIFLNCILAADGVPVFVPENAGSMTRALTVIGDIACDPDSPFNPVPVYTKATTWNRPVVRVHDNPPFDVMAIDNLPSLLPLESTEDFANQLLPHLHTLDTDEGGVWQRANATFRDHV